MTEIQRYKILHFFHVLDRDGNGVLEEKDFTLVGNGISDQIGHASDSRERLSLKAKSYSLFLHILDNLKKTQATLSTEEWLMFFENFVLVKPNLYIHKTSDYLFSLFDQDGDGFLDKLEYLDMFKVYGLYAAHAMKVFDLMDLNSDEKISKQELVKAFNEFFLSSESDIAGNWIFGDWRIYHSIT
jgi:Ca2+-binding EF-hand superfamily protein